MLSHEKSDFGEPSLVFFQLFTSLAKSYRFLKNRARFFQLT